MGAQRTLEMSERGDQCQRRVGKAGYKMRDSQLAGETERRGNA